jgi:hypothetical protein
LAVFLETLLGLGFLFDAFNDGFVLIWRILVGLDSVGMGGVSGSRSLVDLREERVAVSVICNAEHAGRIILGFWESFGQRKDVFAESNCFEQDLFVV